MSSDMLLDCSPKSFNYIGMYFFKNTIHKFEVLDFSRLSVPNWPKVLIFYNFRNEKSLLVLFRDEYSSFRVFSSRNYKKNRTFRGIS